MLLLLGMGSCNLLVLKAEILYPFTNTTHDTKFRILTLIIPLASRTCLFQMPHVNIALQWPYVFISLPVLHHCNPIPLVCLVSPLICHISHSCCHVCPTACEFWCSHVYSHRALPFVFCFCLSFWACIVDQHALEGQQGRGLGVSLTLWLAWLSRGGDLGNLRELCFSTSDMPWLLPNHRSLGRGSCRGMELADVEHPHLGFARNNTLPLIGFNGIHKRDICPILGLIYL